jgi:hypothetical protein
VAPTPRIPIARYAVKAAAVVLLWFLSVSTGVAAPWTRTTHARTGLIRKQASAAVANSLPKHRAAVGGSMVRVRKIGTSLLTRRAHFQRNVRHAHSDDDDDAIQNDAPAAAFDVEPVFGLRPLGIFVEPVEPQSFARHDSPRPPRGPPPAA